MATVDQQVPKPRKSYLPKRSIKSPAIQAEVVARRAYGESKAQISQQLGIAPNTVSGIIELTEIDTLLQDNRLGCAKLLPKSVRVVDHHLNRNSLTAALAILNPLVLSKDAAPRDPSMGNMHISHTIQMLLHPDKPVAAQSDTTITMQVQPAQQDKQFVSHNSDCVKQDVKPDPGPETPT